MEIEYKSSNHKITYDPYNPRVRMEEWKCANCGEWVHEEEVVWMDGKPYHDACEPDVCPRCGAPLETLVSTVECTQCDYWE